MTYRPRDIARALSLACAGASEKDVRARAAYAARWLSAKGQASLLPAVLRLLPEAIREAEGRVAVSVRSARALSPKSIERLLEAAGIDAGRAEISTTEDPALIAGAVAETDSLAFDASLAGRISQLKKFQPTSR